MLHNPAPGLFGGLPGAPGAVFLNGERVERFVPLQFKPGDICVLRVPGGGGYGPPDQRDQELLRRDVEIGWVSPEAAASVYSG